MKADLIITAVTGCTLRSVAGQGEQVEIEVRTRDGDLAIRLLPFRHAFRVTDLRRRDKRDRTPRITVPFLCGEEE